MLQVILPNGKKFKLFKKPQTIAFDLNRSWSTIQDYVYFLNCEVIILREKNFRNSNVSQYRSHVRDLSVKLSYF